MRRALLLALVVVTSCKKQPPPGDLPPVGEAKGAAPAAANPHGDPAPANPHGDTAPANPHGDLPAAQGASPHGAMAGKTEPRSLEKLPDGRLVMGPFALTPPAKWTTKPITSSMRAADFVLPGASPGSDAELIVYYFGETGAGSVDDNLDRWFGQFQQPDGKPSRDAAKIEKTKFGGQDATYVSVAGRFVADAMPGAGEAVDKQDQALLAAIVGSPSGPYYFKLVGPKATVDRNAAAFRAMLTSLQVR